jgi:plastocyanin
MKIKKPKLISLLIAVGLFAMVASAACGGGDPKELDIPVNIEAGKMDPGTIKVKQGDMVTLKIDADEGGEFHLHTYDIEADMEADSVTDFYFVAEATGRFKITYHPQGEHDEGDEGDHNDEDGHGSLFKSEELAPGSTFSYEIEDHQAGETVPFHSHLRPALNGNLIVSEEDGAVGAVAIKYSDEAATPNEVHVGPGTVITWTNNSSVLQTVVSGLHADLVVDEYEHDDGEEEEIEIGFVEVQPR